MLRRPKDRGTITAALASSTGPALRGVMRMGVPGVIPAHASYICVPWPRGPGTVLQRQGEE